MSRRIRSPRIHPLSRATAAILVGCMIAPVLPAQNPFSLEEQAQHAEDDIRRTTADAVVSQGANMALDEVVSYVGDTHLPFLGSLTGGLTYDHANGLLRYNLSTVGKLYGDGTRHHWLGQIGAHNEGDRDTLNAGLIYRWVDIEKAWLIGASLFYDRDFDTGAQRAGLGVEAATQQWRVFSNAYGAISSKWHDALVDGDTWEERVANGYDLGAAWSPGKLPSLDLQLKASRWLGDAVDVFDNEALHRDPLVWSAKVGYTPIPLISLAFEQERVVNGDTNNRIDLQMTYRFGQSLADQLEPSNLARRNDIAARALAPVERQHRIIMEQREKHAPLVFVGPSVVRVTLAADEALAHALMVTGGTGAIGFALEGRDADRFRIADGKLELAPEAAPLEAATRKSLAQPAQTAAEELHVTVVARDTRGREARQGFEVTKERKQVPVPGQVPTMQAPTITGSLVVGETLTGAPQGFNDPDGDGEGRHRYQWYRATDAAGAQRTAIEGATGLQYTLVEADVGAWLVFEVVPVSLVEPFDGLAVSAVTTSGIGEPPQAPTMQAPTITGTIAVGETLTGAPQGFHDINGDGEGTHRYQWYRATDAAGTQRTAIDGATGLQFTITQADVGAWLVFEVIPVSLAEPFDGAAVSTVTASGVGEPPQVPTMQAPTITGTVAVGETLTGAPQGFHDINGDGEGAHRFQWYRATDAAGTSRTAISGATGLQFTITEADIGSWLMFEVIPVSVVEPFEGVPVSATAASAVDEPPRVPTMQAPAITGTIAVGETLTGTPQGFHDANGDGEGAHRYQWYRASDAAGTSRTAISGATGLQFTITEAEIGAWLVFEVVPVSLAAPHDGIAVSTVAASAVDEPPRAPTMQDPTISGTIAVGETLTGTPQGFHDRNGDGEGTHRYQWYRASDAAGTSRTSIDGATGLQFTITEAEIGAWLVFEVVPVSLVAPHDGDAVSTVAESVVDEPPRVPTMQAPTISGTIAVGQTLTGTPQGFHDINGDGEGVHRYQWYRASHQGGTTRTSIAGATGLQYTITEEDIGTWLVFEVIPVSLAAPHDGDPVSTVAASVVDEPPRAPTMQAPTISGSVVVGETLTGTPQGFHDRNGDGEGTHRYQWYRATDAAGTSRARIDGANALSYTLVEADLGTWLVFEVVPVSTAAPFEGNAVSTVTTTAAIDPPTAPTMQAPTIAGNTFIGETLTGTPQGFDDVNGDGEGTHRYQWYRATDAAGTSRTEIDGATGVQFTMTEADLGAWLVFEVIPVSLAAPFEGDSVSAVTATAVEHSPQVPTMGAPTIDGHVGVGRTLTATPNGFDDINGDAPGTHAIQWYRATSQAGTTRTAIPGANEATYVITDADIGSWILAGVTPVSVNAPTHGMEVRAAVNRAVPVPTAPTITAGLSEGEVAPGYALVATANHFHDEDGDAQGTSIHRWYRTTNPTGAGRQLIAGENADTYVIRTEDLGYFIVAGITPVSATGTPDTGTEVFTVTGANVSGVLTYENQDDFAIPESYWYGGYDQAVYSPIEVNGRVGNGPTNASVHVAITHRWQGDIFVALVSPDGTHYYLKHSTDTNDMGWFGSRTYTVDLRGEQLNGTWRLAVGDSYKDNGGISKGTLTAWTLTF